MFSTVLALCFLLKILISPIFNYQLSYIRITYWYYKIIKSKRFNVIQFWKEATLYRISD